MQERNSILGRGLLKYSGHPSLKAGLICVLLAFSVALSVLLVQEGLAQESRDVIVEAVKYRVKGYVYQRQGKLDEAVNFYKKAIKYNPFYACAYNDLGIVYEQKGMLDKAEKYYLKALEIDPNYIVAHTNLALLYERTGELEKARRHWEKRAALGKPSDRWTLRAKERLTQLSLALAEEEKLEQVAEKRQELAEQLKGVVEKPQAPAKELTPEELQKEAALDLADEIAAAKRLEKGRRLTRADQIYQMGLRFYHQGNYEEAVEQFQEVLDLLPGHEEAKKYLGKTLDSIGAQRKERQGQIDLNYNKGLDYFASKRYDLALKKFRKVKELDPNYPDIDRLIQEAKDGLDRAPAEEESRRQRDRLQRESQELRRRREKFQKKIGYYFRKGEDYFASRKYNSALKNFKKVKQLDPNYPNIDTLIREAQEARLRAEPEGRRRKVRREKERFRGKLDSWFAKGEKYYFQGRYDLALKRFQEVKKIDPDYPDVDRRIQETQQALERARFRPKARVEPARKDRHIEREVRRHFKRGESYYIAGDYQKAVQELEEALALDPDHYDANRLLRYCRRRLQPREFRPLVQARPGTLPAVPADVEVTRPRVRPPEIPKAPPRPSQEKARVSTTDLKEHYDIMGVVAHRAKKGEVEQVNVELEKKAKALGGDYVVQVRYFEYEDYLYGYGTAVKLKR